MALRIIYTILVGVFLAIFVGVGISAFYSEPTAPEMPAALEYCSPDIAKNASQFAQFQKEAETFDKTEKVFQKQMQIYNRNVATIAVIAAVLLVVVSLTFLRMIYVIADGILLGGVLTLLYSVLRGFGAQDTMFEFFVVATGLLITLILGYIKFILPKAVGR